MAFPHRSLVASTGRVFAHLFQNRALDLPRALYWGATIRFEPLTYDDESHFCSMTCEWIPWRARTWRDLDGKSLSCNYDDDGVEASFYMVEHDYADKIRLSLAAREDAHFLVTMSMAVEFSGYTGEDANPEMPVSGSVVALFDGVWLRPENFDLTLSDEGELEAIAGEFLDLRDFRMTKDPSGAVVFRPALD